MKRTLRKGDRGEDVRHLQTLLNANLSAYYQLVVDGDFGPKTERAVIAFQKANKVLADGIVGKVTWSALQVTWPAEEITWNDVQPKLRPVRVDVKGHPKSYTFFNPREDLAPGLADLEKRLNEMGAGLSSSGTMRNLNAKVGANRSAKSLHYCGLAIDLHVGSMASNPAKDPYVVMKEVDRYWRVFVATEDPCVEEIELWAWSHPLFKEVPVTRRLIDLTAMLDEIGWKRIRNRKSYSKSNYGAFEAWHFQHEKSLIGGTSRFGDELLKMYTLKQLEGTPPWQWRDSVWQRDWF